VGLTKAEKYRLQEAFLSTDAAGPAESPAKLFQESRDIRSPDDVCAFSSALRREFFIQDAPAKGPLWDLGYSGSDMYWHFLGL
jgi:hypothetical protein